MAISFRFGQRLVTERGVYFDRKSGEPTPIQAPEFGICTLIDTGTSGNFGVGAGINGELAKGKDSIIQFFDLQTFRDYIAGGLHWDIAGALFKPDGTTGNGIDKLNYVSAKTTKSARLLFNVSGGTGGGAEAAATLSATSITNRIQGLGYAVGDQITLSGGTFVTPIIIQVASVDLAGEITGISLVSAGEYSLLPIGENGLEFQQESTTGVGTGATFIGTFGLENIQITNGGSGYTTAPRVFVSGDGLGFVLSATLSGTSVSSVTIVNAGDGFTRPPKIDFIVENGNGGFAEILTRIEGFPANGVELANKVTRGFGYRMISGVEDSSKFIIQFLKGTYTGLDIDGVPYDNTIEVDTVPLIVAESTEFENFQEFLDWAKEDFNFRNWFALGQNDVFGDGTVTSQDLSNLSGNQLANGGTETRSPQDFDDLLEAIADIDQDFILSDKYGATETGARSAENIKLASWAESEAEQLVQIYIGCGEVQNELRSVFGSIPTAQFFNSEKVSLVHGGVEIQSTNGTGFRTKDVFYNTALMLGIEAGVAPQTPITALEIPVSTLKHTLSKKERLLALNSGILFLVPESDNAFVIHQGVNTLQGKKNQRLINQDGTSYEKSMYRIDSALQKEIRVNAKSRKLAGGGNRNTASVQIVRDFVTVYLQSRVSSPNFDSLLIAFRNLQVTSEQDANKVTVEIVKNSPINKLLFTTFTVSV